MARTRIRFSVWLVSGYAHVFVLLSVVIVTLHTGRRVVFILYLYIYKLIYKAPFVTSETLFHSRDGRNHLRYTLHLYPRRDGQAEWPGYTCTYRDGIDPPEVVTNPSTNRARRSLNYVDATNAVTATPNQPCGPVVLF